MSKEYFQRRQNKLSEELSKHNLDGMLVTNMIHIRYLCGFTGSSATLLINQEGTTFISDGRYVFQSEKEVKGASILIDSISHFEVIKNENLLKDGQKIAIDGNNVSYQNFITISKVLSGVELINMTNIIETMAMQKDEKELEAIKTAVEITDRAFAEVFPMVKIGVEEKVIANQLSFLYRKYGDSDSDAFPAIVGAGPNSAKPHHTPTDRKIGPGELLVIDSGAKFAGYHADMTRSFATKGFSEEQKSIYDIVLKAQVDSIKGIKSGVSCKSIDKIARDHIASAGYGKYFDHGLGHSLGLEIHENPRFSKASTDNLGTNYVMTVEPGIYVKDIGGVRIEDDVIVKENGYEVLNKTPKDFHVIS